MKRSREPEEPPLPQLSPSPPPLASPFSTDAELGATPVPQTPGFADSARGNSEQTRAKLVGLSLDLEDAKGPAGVAISCLLHREKMDFPSYEAYESHYSKEHLNRCIECRRNFPSPRYLSLHGDEWHDPFVAVKRDRGEHTYGCFVEGCERKCASADKRRRHLIDKHSFPKNFFFSVTEFGIDGRQSLLDNDRRQHQRKPSTGTAAKKDVRRRAASVTMSGTTASPRSSQLEAAVNDKASSPNISGDECETTKVERPNPQRQTRTSRSSHGAPDVDMEDLAGAMSAMSFVPRSVRFGRGGKAGFSRR